jgi:gluconokinase
VPVVLALDLGSSFIKAQRFDETGAALGQHARQPAGIGVDGRADLEEVVGAAEAVVDEVLSEGPDPSAVAVSSAWHTLVGVDDDGRATTELSTWMDDRASEEAAALREAVVDAADVHDRVGAPIHPSLPSARILWLARQQPDAFAATRRWCSLAEIVASRWFGERVGPSSSIASGTGLYNQRSRAWDDELLAAIRLGNDRLHPVDDEPRTGLAPAYRTRWPALAAVPWFPAQGDGACAVIGSGCTVPGRAALTVGTSAAVRVLSDADRRGAAPLPAALFGYLVESETPVVGAARSNAGAAVQWTADALGLTGLDVVEEATFGRRPGGHGLVVDPSLITERSPRWPLTPSARMDGLRRATTRVDILQAFVEAIALGVADAVDALEAWAGRQTLVLGGGAASSAAWRQLLADVIGQQIVCSPVTDDSARGAALLASTRMGEAMPPPPAEDATVEPDPARAAAFADIRAARTASPFAASLGP